MIVLADVEEEAGGDRLMLALVLLMNKAEVTPREDDAVVGVESSSASS